MRKDDSRADDSKAYTAQSESPGAGRKPYATPRLVTHGDLRKLALGSGGKRGDGKGKPSSKK